MALDFISLGEILDRYKLTSDRYISERMIAKIDKVTNSMAEQGFYQFYHSISDFSQKWVFGKFDKDEVDLQSITIEQLRRPIMIILLLNGIASILFVAEILIFKWLKWRNREQRKNVFEFILNVFSFFKKYSISVRPCTDFTTCEKATEIGAKSS